MKPNQFATIDEAKAIAAKLGVIGGGVADTYIPEYLGPYSTPENGPAKFYHFRFHNGAAGFNVGLIRTTMMYYPSSWPLMIATEVNAMANYSVDDQA
jgi:hypothetical protein